MVASLKVFVAILLLSLIGMGLSQLCKPDNLNIGQQRTGKTIQNKTEWSVTVTNNCNCGRRGIVLSCAQFQTAEPVDPAILKPATDGYTCFFLPNQVMKPHQSVTFSYAWDPSYVIIPLRTFNTCSSSSFNTNLLNP